MLFQGFCVHELSLASHHLFFLLPDARTVATASLTMSLLVKVCVLLMFVGCLMACSPWFPSSDPQTEIKPVHNAPLAHSAQASSILNKERDSFNEHIEESYTLAGPQPDEAQHPLGPFKVVSGSHDSLLVILTSRIRHRRPCLARKSYLRPGKWIKPNMPCSGELKMSVISNIPERQPRMS